MRSAQFLFRPMAVFAAVSLCPVVAADVIFVDKDAAGHNDGSSWKDAFIDLQQGLAAAFEGDEIWVAEGAYTPTGPDGDREATFQLQTGVGIYGGFAGDEVEREERDPSLYLTVLSGDLNGDDGPEFENNGENTYHVLTGTGAEETALLDGFQVTSGNATRFFPNHGGGGLYVGQGGNPTIQDCGFSGNIAIQGGAVNLWFGSASFRNCCFEANETDTTSGRGGVLYIQHDSRRSVTEFVSCMFIDNAADVLGGAAYITGASVNMQNCVVRDNQGPDIVLISSNGALIMANCSVLRNTGAVLLDVVDEASLTVVNSVLAHNTMTGVGVFGGGQSLSIANSIVWENGGPSQADQIIGAASINYTILQGWDGTYGGEGNNGLDPLFVDPDGPDDIPGTEDDDLRLSSDSPAIDSGDNLAVPPDEFDLDEDGDIVEPIPLDLDGLPRFVDDPATEDTGAGKPPIVDRGPYEFQVAVECEGDANSDGTVDPLDAGFVLSRFGCEVGGIDPTCAAADVNADLVVDPLDVGYVLARFGLCE